MKWGIVGLGKIAKTFANEFQFVKDSKIYRVGSRDVAKSRDFAIQFGIENYGTYDEVFKDENVDIVYISTPHHLHFELTKEALLNNKHVLCEKPITVNAIQFRELSEIADKKKLFLMDGMWTYFLPATKKVLEWVHTDRIGSIKYIQIDFAFKGNNDPLSRINNIHLAGGSLLDIGLYPLYYTFLLKGLNFKSLHCHADKGNTYVDQSISIDLEYQHTKVHLYSSFEHRTRSCALIYGQHGYIEVPLFWKASHANLYNEQENLIEKFYDERLCHGFVYQIEHVLTSIISGKIQSEILPHSLTGRLIETMDVIRDQIELKYPFE